MIITKLIGGLGNQMFQYAAGLELAKKWNVPLKIDVNHLNKNPNGAYTQRQLELSIFNLPINIATETEINLFHESHLSKLLYRYFGIKNKYQVVNEIGQTFNSNFYTLTKNTYLNGFWQNQKYFINSKIEVVNSTNFKSLATISGLSLPRYMLAVNANKAYVSQWGSSGVGKGIRVVDLTNNTAGSLIPAGNGPEKMLQNGNLVYVVNSGGLDFDSTVTIINSNSDAVVANIVVGDNPNSIVLDKNGKIWVLCGGVIDYITPANGIPGKLVRIDPTSNTIEASFTFVSHSEHPLNLCTNTTKDKLYFLGNLYSLGSLYSMDITAGALPTTPLINRNFYSLGIDPVTNQIFAGYAPTFSSNGWVLRYSPAAALLDSFQVGIIPSGFCFQ